MARNSEITKAEVDDAFLETLKKLDESTFGKIAAGIEKLTGLKYIYEHFHPTIGHVYEYGGKCYLYALVRGFYTFISLEDGKCYAVHNPTYWGKYDSGVKQFVKS